MGFNSGLKGLIESALCQELYNTVTGGGGDSNTWTTAMYYSVAEYFKIIQAAQVYQSDIRIDFVTGQIKFFRILCYLLDFVRHQCNGPLHTNFTTN
jgi:hypothetical protein